MTVLCSLKNLTLTFPHKTLLNNVNFTLNEGDKIGVLGLNGHGKSSLFKIMAGLISADTTVPPFIFDKNKDFTLFLVPQELPVIKGVSLKDYFYEFYPEMKKAKVRLDEIAEKLSSGEGDFDKLLDEQAKLFDKLTDLGEDRVYPQYTSYLKYFGAKDLDASFETCSGGEQRKVALSLGLSAPHKVILWDEPTNHLDLETIELFEDELMNSRKTFMMISHDRSLLNNVVDRIVHIQNGNILTFKGTYTAYLEFLKDEQRRREKEIDKLSNIQRRESIWMSRGPKARGTKSKKRIEGYHDLNNRITELKGMAHKSAKFNVKGSGRKTKILADIQNVSLSFGELSLFNDISLKIAKGDKIALLGKNGVGKSSLLKALMGDIPVTSGNVKLAENLSVGFFSQKRESLKPEMTPWELIGEGIDFVISNTGEKKHVASYLGNFLFKSEELKRPISSFSGGEKNRLQLAQFMKNAQDVWIFDEPTNDLDLETIGILEEELKNYQGALIVVGHDRTFIENVTNKCWLLHDKKMEIFDGGFEQAELFIEALRLEDKLKELPQEEIKIKEEKPKKLSYKEKLRYEELPGKIEEMENRISSLEKKVESFDYSNLDKDASQELASIQKDIENNKENLETLYEEWTELESRI
jgi:ATP-binding cassette subfamily F protein uup